MLHEYDISGEHIKSIHLPKSMSSGPFYLDDENVVLMQDYPFTDSMSFPHIVKINLVNEKVTPIHFIDFQRNTDRSAGLYANNQFSRNDQGVQYRYCLEDTVYQVGFDSNVKPIVSFDIGDNRWPSYSIRMDQDHFDNVGIITFLPKHMLIIGNYQKRFHEIYSKETSTLFTLPEINECRLKESYCYGIINDLEGLKPLWPFSSPYITELNSRN